MSKLTLGSFFSGSGGFELAGIFHGIEPLWASEIEPFPIRVTTKRFPNMLHLGDISKINGANIPPVDIITGGFPCTDLSNAGLRKGIHAERSAIVQVAVEKHQHGNYREVETAGTLKASGGDYPGGENIIIENKYVVRRLTPQECAMLQGFVPDYCAGLETAEPTEEDIAFWSDVWETHRRIVGKAKKPKSRNQIMKWLKNPHADSAEYKLWGNGVCVNCVSFVLGGIVWLTSQQA